MVEVAPYQPRKPHPSISNPSVKAVYNIGEIAATAESNRTNYLTFTYERKITVD